VNNEDMDQLI